MSTEVSDIIPQLPTFEPLMNDFVRKDNFEIPFKSFRYFKKL